MKPANEALDSLSSEQRRTLLSIMRGILEDHYRSDTPHSTRTLQSAGDYSRISGYRELRHVLSAQCGLFVTLKLPHLGGQLRGCIGRMTSTRPLRESLPEVVLDAALKDPRFPPLGEDELPAVRLELSLLSPMREVEGVDHIVIGRHGIYLRCGGASAVFLPEVAFQQGWNLQTTLGHLSLKAGLPSEAWRRDDARFWVFTSVHFAEGEE